MKDFRFVRLLFIALLAAVLPACTSINENEGTTVLSVELLDQTDNGAKMEFKNRVTGLPIRAVHDK